MDVLRSKKASVTFSFDMKTLDSAGLAAYSCRRLTTSAHPIPIFFAQATPYVYQFYRMYFDMADEYDWEQYLPDIPESQVWTLVDPIWDRCTIAWDITMC